MHDRVRACISVTAPRIEAGPWTSAMSSSSVDVQTVRGFKKHVLRPYRLLCNAMNASLTDFTSTLVEGKAVTTALSNDILQVYSIGDWVETLGLAASARSLLRKRLETRIRTQREKLVNLLESLRQTVRAMDGALTAFREGVWATLDGDIDDHAREHLRDMAMCSHWTHRQVCCAMERVVGMCGREVDEAKALVVEDFLHACDALASSQGAASGGGGHDAWNTREYWEIHVLTWMTDVFVERDEVERTMAAMAADASLPYYRKLQ